MGIRGANCLISIAALCPFKKGIRTSKITSQRDIILPYHITVQTVKGGGN
jgi:hypothetical protein